MIKPSLVNEQLRAPHHGPELISFMASYFADGAMRVRPPQRGMLRVEGVTSLVIYREPPFQVEMIIVEPGVEIPPHVHPDVDSYELSFAGAIDFFVDGVQTGFVREPRADGMCRDFGKFVGIPSDAPHSGKAGPSGAVFLSVQRWRDGVEPTNVGLNWRGLTMGPIHSAEVAT